MTGFRSYENIFILKLLGGFKCLYTVQLPLDALLQLFGSFESFNLFSFKSEIIRAKYTMYLC